MNHNLRLLAFASLVLVLFAGCITLDIMPPRQPQQASVGSTRSLSGISPGNNQTVRLEAGTYTGRLVINANAATVVGAGVGRTIIRGDVVINGNTNELSRLTVTGSITVTGNNNDLSKADVSGASVSTQGNNNRY